MEVALTKEVDSPTVDVRLQKRSHFEAILMGLPLLHVVAVSLVLGSAVTFANSEVIFPPARPPSNDVVMENLVPVPMRDGVILYADVYRPSGPGKYPVLVSRTPYSTERFPSSLCGAGLLCAQRLCLRLPGCPGPP